MLIMRTADLPLHSGHAPRWLFSRMVEMSGLISRLVISEKGGRAFLERLSDPFWFQAFACAIGFDWHSSGATTVTLGALKQAFSSSDELKIYGGKGKAMSCIPEEWKTESRMAFRTDTVALQDGYNIYHHSLISYGKHWAVIQQGMKGHWARRYHWMDAMDFMNSTRSGLAAERPEQHVMDLSSRDSRDTRKAVVELVNDEGARLSRYAGSLWAFAGRPEQKVLNMPKNIDWQSLNNLKDMQLSSFEELMLQPGSAKLIRALSLIAHLVYGTEISWKDPVHYAYAFGGKDGVPYPVNRGLYDSSIRYLREIVEGLDISRKERLKALSRLDRFVSWT